MLKTDPFGFRLTTSSPVASWFFAFWARTLVLAALAFVPPAWAQGSFEQFFQAIKIDNLRALQSLKARGFDLNTRSESNEPPLLIALREGSLQVASYLIAQPEQDLDARNGSDENALMLAAIKGHLEPLRALIERKAQVNKPGWTPLHYAASHAGAQAPAMVELLLEHHAYIDASSPNGSTPLMLAAMYGDARSVDVLLQAGADPRIVNQAGLNAIDFAQRAGRTSVAERIAAAVRALQPKGQW